MDIPLLDTKHTVNTEWIYYKINCDQFVVTNLIIDKYTLIRFNAIFIGAL